MLHDTELVSGSTGFQVLARIVVLKGIKIPHHVAPLKPFAAAIQCNAMQCQCNTTKGCKNFYLKKETLWLKKCRNVFQSGDLSTNASFIDLSILFPQHIWFFLLLTRQYTGSQPGRQTPAGNGQTEDTQLLVSVYFANFFLIFGIPIE